MLEVPRHRFWPIERLRCRLRQGSFDGRLRGVPRARRAHVDAAKRFVLADPGEEAKIEKEMKETITKTPSDKVCSSCHIQQAHGRHPAYEGQRVPQVARGSVDPCCPAILPAHNSAAMAAAAFSSRYSVKTCGGCHYDQYKQWQVGEHTALSAMLPAKYANDQSCQNCHANMAAANASAGGDPHHNRIGVACESCHGPALEHVYFNKQFISGPALGPKLEQEARNSIRKGKPDATCIQCHIRQSHKQHPAFEK